MENKSPIPPKTLILIAVSVCIGITFPLFLLHRTGFPTHLLWIVGGLTLLIGGATIAMAMKSAQKRAPLEKRLAEQDPKTFQRIMTRGLVVLIIGGLFNLLGRQIIGLLWIAAGFGLIKKKEWGLWFFIVLASFHVLAIGIAFMSGAVTKAAEARHVSQYAPYIYAAAALFTVFLSWNLYFFTRPEVREAFKLAKKEAAVPNQPASLGPTA